MYGAAFGNANQARRVYAGPSGKLFTRVYNRLRETGSFQINMRDTGRPRSARTVEFEEHVLDTFEDDPTTSVEEVARLDGSSSSNVWRVLREEKLHLFHYQKVQSLLSDDFAPRENIAQWVLQRNDVDPNFLNTILFSAEYVFTREGVFNSRNSDVWSLENPHEIAVRHHQHRFSVNVRAGELLKCDVWASMDWARWSRTVACSFTGSKSTRFFSFGDA